MSGLDALAHEWLGAPLARAVTVAFLVCCRTLPLAFVAPWLGWKGTPMAARLAVGFGLALALTPLALSSAPSFAGGWLPLALLGVREVLVGLAFAIASSVPLWALAWTGSLVDRWRLSADAPAGESPLELLHVGAGVVLFLMLGGHRLALRAFAGTLVDAPIGAGARAGDLAAFALGAGQLVTAALELAVLFAAPAAIAFVLLEVVRGLSARVGPQLADAAVATPLRAALGVAITLIGLAALLPRLGPVFADSIEAAADVVRQAW